MLRPQWLESAIGGPLTKALNKAYASRLQSVQDREKSSGPDAGLASASSLPSSPYEPAEIDSALLSPRHRMQGRRALRPIRPPVATPSHAHWRCGSAGLDQPLGQALHRRGDGRAWPTVGAGAVPPRRLGPRAPETRGCDTLAACLRSQRGEEVQAARAAPGEWKAPSPPAQAQREGRAAALPSTFGAAAAKIAWTSSRSAPASTRADARRAGWRSVRLVAESGAESCRAYPRKPKLGPSDCTHAHAALKPERKRTTSPMLLVVPMS